MLSPEQQKHLTRAMSYITPESVAQAAALLVNISSPTGEEGELARAVVRRLTTGGIEASEQRLDKSQSNALAVLRGSGSKPSLLLYAPTDPVTAGNDNEDLPWAGPALLPEMKAEAHIANGYVSGLGAHNPKGHGACALIAFEAMALAGIPLTGDLWLGLGAGGMPTDARPGQRAGSGHGVGCAYMLEHGILPDAAVIAKSGWAISWEEVGLAWYEIEVDGGHTYVGSRHLIQYSNAIANAAIVVQALEEWFPLWAEVHRSGLVAPQGVVSFIEGGWERMPAFTPAMCRLRIDLRLSPRTSEAEADTALDGVLKDVAARHGLQIRWKRLMAIPGTTTAPESGVVRSCIAAWEEIEQRPHVPIAGMSGATDANILRGFGVPTARVGLPKVNLPGVDFQRGMNMVSIDDMVRLTRLLVHVAVDMCTD